MARRLIVPFMVAFVAVGPVLAGCSADPSGTSQQPSQRGQSSAAASPSTAESSGTAATLDPCSVLTADQVAAALGQPSAPGKQKPNFDTPQCEWVPASGQNGTVTLEVGPWEGNPGVKPLRLGTPVSGVGDEAYDAGNTGLYVRKGSQGLRIWVFNVHTQSSRLDLEKQLTGLVLAKL
jgi:hypothetical protein